MAAGHCALAPESGGRESSVRVFCADFLVERRRGLVFLVIPKNLAFPRDRLRVPGLLVGQSAFDFSQVLDPVARKSDRPSGGCYLRDAMFSLSLERFEIVMKRDRRPVGKDLALQ